MAIICRLSSEGNIAGLDDKQKRSLMEYVKNHSENKCDDITGSAQCASLDEQIENNIFAIMSISKDEYSEYSRYIKSENLKGKKIAIVDSRTENFSAQRLLETVLDEKIFGLYYVVGEDNNQYQYSSYQKERQNLLLCWQIIEYILSAPTPSIQAVRDGGPVFGEYNTYEKERIEIFKYIEKGVIEFTNLLKKRTLLECSVNEEIIRNWINNFSLYGDKTDREMFADLKFASNPNHTEYMDLTVFMDKKENINYREKLFRWLTLHPDLYAKVRAIYRWLKK